jgi:hypothetical protein
MNYSATSTLPLTARRFSLEQHLKLQALTVMVLLGCVFYAILVLQAGVVSLAVFVQWTIIAAAVCHPMFGVMALFGLMGMFEPGGADPLMGFGGYLHGGISTNFNLSGFATTPVELFLVALVLAWLARGVAQRNLASRPSVLDIPVGLFAIVVVLGLIRGLADRGDLQIGLWEARSLFYIPIAYFIAKNTLRSRADVRALIRFTLIGITCFGIEGVYRKHALINTNTLGGMADFAYSHESVIFIAILVVTVAAQAAFGASKLERWLGPAALTVCAYTLLASERRAGFIALGFAFLAFALILLRCHRRAFVMIAMPTIVAAGIYLPVFWSASGMIGQPARAVRSLISPDPRDAASNLYRDLEKVNVRATLKANPLLGVGFGKEFYFVVQVADLSWWPFWHFEPHHNVLWVWLKTGAHGFIVFLVLMGATVARATSLAVRSRAPECRVFAVMTLAGVVATLVFSYVDLGLVVGRVTIWLGIAMGVLAVLHKFDQTSPHSQGA